MLARSDLSFVSISTSPLISEIYLCSIGMKSCAILGGHSIDSDVTIAAEKFGYHLGLAYQVKKYEFLLQTNFSFICFDSCR